MESPTLRETFVPQCKEWSLRFSLSVMLCNDVMHAQEEVAWFMPSETGNVSGSEFLFWTAYEFKGPWMGL